MTRGALELRLDGLDVEEPDILSILFILSSLCSRSMRYRSARLALSRSSASALRAE